MGDPVVPSHEHTSEFLKFMQGHHALGTDKLIISFKMITWRDVVITYRLAFLFHMQCNNVVSIHRLVVP